MKNKPLRDASPQAAQSHAAAHGRGWAVPFPGCVCLLFTDTDKPSALLQWQCSQCLSATGLQVYCCVYFRGAAMQLPFCCMKVQWHAGGFPNTWAATRSAVQNLRANIQIACTRHGHQCTVTTSARTERLNPYTAPFTTHCPTNIAPFCKASMGKAFNTESTLLPSALTPWRPFGWEETQPDPAQASKIWQAHMTSWYNCRV